MHTSLIFSYSSTPKIGFGRPIKVPYRIVIIKQGSGLKNKSARIRYIKDKAEPNDSALSYGNCKVTPT